MNTQNAFPRQTWGAPSQQPQNPYMEPKHYDQFTQPTHMGFQGDANKSAGIKKDGRIFKYMKVDVVVPLESLFSFDTLIDSDLHEDSLKKIEQKKQDIQNKINENNSKRAVNTRGGFQQSGTTPGFNPKSGRGGVAKSYSGKPPEGNPVCPVFS